MTKEKKYSRRRQQVKRQILIIVILAVLAVAIPVIYTVRSSAEEQKTSGAISSSEGIKGTLQETDRALQDETPRERLARVKKTAVERGYPAGVIELLDKNEETIEFVANYEEKKDSSPAQTIGDDLIQGEIPELIQWDERWGYASYGTSIVAVSGCGPTCLSMVASGLTGDASITPASVAAYGTANGYVDEENNTYWKLMSDGCAAWGLTCYEGEIEETVVVSQLQAGHPIICSVGPGDFTDKGHFIVLAGYEDGKIKVNDPFSKANTENLWEFERLEGQIKALWIYSLKR
ncbi:hypothetical protein FND36_05440 [Lachnospiraceae bacterium KGMB03038]|nr:hypothetical protein FND36_05440 [Lachnospiraceae bacterium KGMB03038]